MKNEVVVVIVTHNGIKWIDKCLSSCKEYRTIVVDNNSKDDTVKFIKENFPEVTLIKQQSNLGFGQANNIGISYALNQGAEAVFLLNQDAYIFEDTIENLVEFHKQNEEYGILSPMHLKSSKNMLDEKFEYYLRNNTNVIFNTDSILKTSLKAIIEITFVNAAAWLITKECLKQVGGFDPIFSHYGEDDNYCQRALFHDFKIGVFTQSFIIHDREIIDKTEPTPYTELYYKTKERVYKMRYANVRLTNNLENLDLQLKKLRNKSIKLLLKGQLRNFNNMKREFYMLKSIKSPIIKSRTINKTIGSHYL